MDRLLWETETNHVGPAKSNEDKGYKHMKTNMDSPLLMSISVPLLFLDMFHNEQNFPMLF